MKSLLLTLCQYKKTTLLLLVVLFVVPFYFLAKLQINNSPAIYLPEDAPSVVLEKKILENFPSDQVLIVLFENEHFMQPEFILKISRLVQSLEEIENVDRVISILNVDQIEPSQSGFSVDYLVTLDELEELEAEEILEQVRGHEFSSGMLVSDKKNILAVIVRPVPLDSTLQRKQIYDLTLDEIASQGLQGEVVAIGGQIRVDVEQLRSMLSDTVILVPLTVFLGLCIVYMLYRRVLYLVLTLVLVGLVTTWTISLLPLFAQPYTLTTAMLPSLMSALTTASLVHYFGALNHEQSKGWTGNELIVRSLMRIHRPVFFTALTTSLGLLSLAVNEIPPIKYFGLTASLGVFFMYVFLVFVLPCLHAALEKGGEKEQVKSYQVLENVLVSINRFSIKNNIAVIVFFLCVSVFSAFQISNLNVESDFLKLFSNEHPVNQSSMLIEDSLTGVTSLEVLFESKESGTDIVSSSALNSISQFQEWVFKLDEIDKVYSPVNFIKDLNWAFNEGDDAKKTIPAKDDLIKQYLLVYDGEDIYEFLSRDYEQVRVVLSANVHGAKDIGLLITKIENHLLSVNYASYSTAVGGFGNLFAKQERLLITGQLHSMIVALLVIFSAMFLMWRSLGVALLCMLPNVAPILFIFGIMGFFGISLDMATAMIASVALGIAVDDTIHVYEGYRRHRFDGSCVVEALQKTGRITGVAITITTLILSIQFFSLYFSDFYPTKYFGLLASVGLFSALLFDLFLLPAVISLSATREKMKT